MSILAGLPKTLGNQGGIQPQPPVVVVEPLNLFVGEGADE